MGLHTNVYSFVYRGEDSPATKDVIWIHHEKKNDLQSAMVAEIWIRNKWEPLIWGYRGELDNVCCCCGSPFVREEGKASAAMREASNVAKGSFSFSAGYRSKALGNNSITIGTGLVADADNQIVLGSYNERGTNHRFVFGIGTSDSDRRNAITISESGLVTIPNLNTSNIDYWDKGSGDNAVQLKGGSSASGVNSVAEGLDTIASGNFSHSEGLETQATGKSSHSEGEYSIASGECSHTEGRTTKASGLCSHAEGYNTDASGGYAHSEGLNTEASGARSHAEGMNTIAHGIASHAEGDGTAANGARSHASGKNTQANGDQSFCQGTRTIATNENESAFGKYNKINSNQIFSIGVGSDESSRRNAIEVLSSGEVNIPKLKDYVRTDLLRTDEELRSVSLGFGASATGEDSIAVGRNTYATGDRSQAFGNESEARGYASHAEGYYTTAIGIESHAEGIRTMAYGDGSHAEGNAIDTYECVSFGAGSHAEGSSIATGERAHSEGVSNLIEIEIEYSNGTIDAPHTHITADIPSLLEDLNVTGYSDIVGKFFQIDWDFYQVQSIEDNGDDNFTIGIYPAMLHFSNTNTMVFQMGGAQGRTSHTEGSHCVAYGNDSHAEGAGCVTYGDDAHAEGITTIARGNHSHAEGDTSEANGDISHAEGDHCRANGQQSHAGGVESAANGDNSFAFGNFCDAEGDSNIAVGHHVFTNGYVPGEFACGKYNDPGATTIFSLGIGADNEHRQNAIEVLSDGTIRFYNSGDGNYYTLQQIINAINNN